MTSCAVAVNDAAAAVVERYLSSRYDDAIWAVEHGDTVAGAAGAVSGILFRPVSVLASMVASRRNCSYCED